MEYSPPRPVSHGLAAVHSTFGLVAAANGNLLTIYDAMNDVSITTITTAAPITHVIWSPPTITDAPPVVAAVSAPGGNVVVVEVDANQNYPLQDDEGWRVIADVHGGLLEVAWLAVTPRQNIDDEHKCAGVLILGFEHAVATTIIDYTLGKILSFVPFATRAPSLLPTVDQYILSPCASLIALLLRDAPNTPTDALLILSAIDGRCVATCKSPGGIVRITGLRWLQSLDGCSLLIWGRREAGCASRVMALVAADGDILWEGPIVSNGRLNGGNDCGDGAVHAAIRAVECRRGVDLIAVGGDDGSIRVVDALTGVVLHVFTHVAPRIDDEPPIVFKEQRMVVRERSRLSSGGTASGNEKEEELETEEVREELSAFYEVGADDVRTVEDAGEGGVRRRRRGRRSSGGAGEEEMRIASKFDVVPFDSTIEIGRAQRADGIAGRVVGADGKVRRGVAWIAMSDSGKYMASADVGMRHVVMIWDIARLCLRAVLILQAEVVSAEWGSGGTRLAMGCGGGWVYFWDVGGAAVVRVEGGVGGGVGGGVFGARRVRWLSESRALVLVDGLRARAFVTMFLHDAAEAETMGEEAVAEEAVAVAAEVEVEGG